MQQRYLMLTFNIWRAFVSSLSRSAVLNVWLIFVSIVGNLQIPFPDEGGWKTIIKNMFAFLLSGINVVFWGPWT